MWYTRQKNRVKCNTANINFDFNFQRWLNWLSYHTPAPPNHEEHDKYHTTRHQDNMHNKFWYDCCILDTHKCIVGTSEEHCRSNDDCEHLPIFHVVPNRENKGYRAAHYSILKQSSEVIEVQFLAHAILFPPNKANSRKDWFQLI